MMFNFFDDFENLFSKVSNNFMRPVKDQQPFSVYSSTKGYVIVCNTLGIDRDDLRIFLKKENGNPYPVLSITGETKVEKFNISNNVNLKIRLCMTDKFENITYESKNGLTFIYLKTNIPAEETMEAKPIDDDNDGALDF